MSGVEIRVDPELCQGSRQCSFVAPGVFTHEDDGTAVVVDPHAAPLDEVRKAAEFCPNLAITLVVDGEVVHEGL